MANWYGTARSNYVKIRDMEGLKQALQPFHIKIHTAVAAAYEGKTCFLSEDLDSGGWPGICDDDLTGEEVEFDPAVMICPFMEDDQILVMIEAGAEGLRYISGTARAYNAKGDACWLNLNDIYDRASTHFGVDRSTITLAEY